MAERLLYPVSPALVDDTITRPSPAFRKEVYRVILSIVGFIFAYVILVLSAIALAFLAGFLGIMLVGLRVNFITLLGCIGLMGMGVLVIVFLIKFIFQRAQTNESQFIEVTRNDQPDLFEFVDRLTREVGTPTPRKIYLSPDVNASVFYNSGFWSMFLPMRKKLNIGLGMVNAVNVSEFKAIIAHEFGHFSQRSMKLGTYVYNVNHVIYNMLYNNDGYNSTLEGFGSIHYIFYACAKMAHAIVRFIQFLLRSLYADINKKYLSLSRQMEFHADAVAASVTGGNHLVTSLRRIEIAETCYQRTLHYYNSWIAENKKTNNIYTDHTTVMNAFAREYKIPTVNGLMQINRNSFHQFVSSRVAIKDQWASHPSVDDREENLNRLNLITETSEQSAWNLFREPAKLQQEMTAWVYRDTTFAEKPVVVNEHEFKEQLELDTAKYTIDPVYRGLYDSRYPDVAFNDLKQTATKVHNVLTDENVRLPKLLSAYENELSQLDHIINQAAEVQTFDFEGVKYNQEDAVKIKSRVEQERKEAEDRLRGVDRTIGDIVFTAAQTSGAIDEMRKLYEDLAVHKIRASENWTLYVEVLGILQPAYSDGLTVAAAMDIDNKLKLREKAVKNTIEVVAQEPSFGTILTAEEQNVMKRYLESRLNYYDQTTGFNNEGLMLLRQALDTLAKYMAQQEFTSRKALLDWQVRFL